jgi:MoaA/NifB/PqqE/SkfB family radical SAM enzyme
MRDVTLLWAVRSACALACRYCYFGTVDEHRVKMPDQPGTLSHLARNDLPAAEILAFARSLGSSPVRSVVIAGGEPLDWPHMPGLIAEIKRAGCAVTVATNGVPLARDRIARLMVSLAVDAVSVSLDSPDAAANDRYRPSRSGRHGHADVLAGIAALRAARGSRPLPRIGIYTVITRANAGQITHMAGFAAELGADYFVPQPVSLAEGHALHAELSLRPADANDIAAQLTALYGGGAAVQLPEPDYPRRFLQAITGCGPARIRDCFGGARLFFIQPDGSLWDCPSSLRIAATTPARRRNIRGQQASHLLARRPACTDCRLFSADCVNMWPLMHLQQALQGNEDQ